MNAVAGSRHQAHHPRVSKVCAGCWGWRCRCGSVHLTRADGFRNQAAARANATSHLLTVPAAR